MIGKSGVADVVRLLVDAAQVAGEQPEWLKEMLALVERELTRADGSTALEVVRKRPADKRRQRVLADEVQRCVARDVEFARALREALGKTKARRKSFHADVRRMVAANVDGDLTGNQEVNAVVGEGVAASGSARVKVNRSRRRKISIWGISITVAGSTTATLLLLPGGGSESPRADDHGGSGATTSSSAPPSQPSTGGPEGSGPPANNEQFLGPGGGSGPGASPNRGPTTVPGQGGGSGSGGGPAQGGGGTDPGGGNGSDPPPPPPPGIQRQLVTSNFTIQPGNGWDTVATCPAGKAPTGGGFFFGSDSGVLLDISRPATNGSGWHVHATNYSSQTHTITGYAVCATP